MTNEDIIKDMGEWQEEQDEAAKAATSKRRRKRFNWDDFDTGGGDDDDGGGSKTDYSKVGIGALSKKFNTLMVRLHYVKNDFFDVQDGPKMLNHTLMLILNVLPVY